MKIEIQQAPFHQYWGNDALQEGWVEVPSPQNIHWYPQAPGWSFVLLIIVAWLLLKLYQFVKRFIKNTYRRKALIKLNKISTTSSECKWMAVLLKRTALYAFQRSEVASLSGEQWEAWLDSQCSQCQFSTTHKGQLSLLAYDQGKGLSQQTIDQLYRQIYLWVRFHKGGE